MAVHIKKKNVFLLISIIAMVLLFGARATIKGGLLGGFGATFLFGTIGTIIYANFSDDEE